MSIATLPEVRNTSQGMICSSLEKLINGLVNKLLHYYWMQNVKVSHFIAVGWTSQGRKLCKLLGMRQVGHDKYKNPIFLLEIEKIDLNTQILDSIKKLKRTYDNTTLIDISTDIGAP